ncbi:MAG: hypothetical protein QOH16_1473 [Gaiellaceae bacterium]|nr:hypothetical protein [Gaiellaceae bacterium]
MSKLIERFAVEPGQRDQAIEHVQSAGYEVIEVEDGGVEPDRAGANWPVIVVRSSEDLDATASLRQTFATAVGELLDAEGLVWRHVAPPSPYVDEGGKRMLRFRRLFTREGNQ